MGINTMIAALDRFSTSEFHRALAADSRSPTLHGSDDAYGWLVGDWTLEVLHYWGENVSSQRIRGEVRAGWVLEGLAVQDVWIMPQRGERASHIDKRMNMYGTTLRVWDPTIEAWRISWRNPAGGHFEDQIGRRVGDEIIQIGTRPDGTTTRWAFTEITPESFHWLGEALQHDGRTWNLEGEFLARRVRG